MKKQRELAFLYLDKAVADQVLLETIVENFDVSEEIYGFHAQQAIEKLLKALLTVLDIRLGKTHDIRWLMDSCAHARHPLPEKLETLDLLTPYGVAGRYELVPYRHPFSRSELLEMIKTLRAWVEEQL